MLFFKDFCLTNTLFSDKMATSEEEGIKFKCTHSLKYVPPAVVAQFCIMHENNMLDQEALKDWLKTNCPLFWSFLNKRAQSTLPDGIVQYLGTGSTSEIETGKDNFKTIEKYLSELVSLCGKEKVGDNYRRDFSGVNSENKLSEMFCEIALCATVSSYSGSLELRPETGKGTFSDCQFRVNDHDIFAEVKRYQDSWLYIENETDNKGKKVPFSRSIYKSPLGKKPSDAARPRHMDIQSKLEDVHRQFPDGTINILFIFHPSLGQSKNYLIQAMLGEANFLREEQDLVLEDDGLFAKEEWRNISACCLAIAYPESKVIFPAIIENPRAMNPVPGDVVKKMKSHA